MDVDVADGHAKEEETLDTDLQQFLVTDCKLSSRGQAAVRSELLHQKLQSFKAVFARYRDDFDVSPDMAFHHMAEDLPLLHDTHRRMLLHEAKDRATQAAVLAVLASASSFVPATVLQVQHLSSNAPVEEAAAATYTKDAQYLTATHGRLLLREVADRAASAAAMAAAICDRPTAPTSDPRLEPPDGGPPPESVPAATEAADATASAPAAAAEALPQPDLPEAQAATLQNTGTHAADAEAAAVAAPPPEGLPSPTGAPPEPSGPEQRATGQQAAAKAQADAVDVAAVEQLDGVEGLLMLARPGGGLAPNTGGADGAASAAAGFNGNAAGPAVGAQPAGAEGQGLQGGLPLASGALQPPMPMPPHLGLLAPPFLPAGMLLGGPVPNGAAAAAAFALGPPLGDGALAAAAEPLAALEATEVLIKNVSVQHFFQEADALLQISEHRLFEAAGYSSFSEYITKSGRLRIQLRQARHLVAAARFMRSLPPDVPRPRNERQVRPLTGQPPEVALAAWRLALARAQASGEGVCNRITAECVAEVLQQMDAAGVPRPQGRRGPRPGKSPSRVRGRESDSED